MEQKILLTFDYELFLGKDSGTIEKCILEPTNLIIDILEKRHAKGLFFIDSTFLLVLKKDFPNGYTKIKKQILHLLSNGHDIGLHIHPHWIDSYMISNNKWSFKKYNNFRIHNLSKDKISKIIYDSYNELNLIAREYSLNYKIDCFRAGGWCIQPFNQIKKILESLGIKYDFSVLPGLKKENLPKHYYNYTKAPKKTYWKFNYDVLIEEKDGLFIEIPMTIIKMNLLDVFKTKKAIKKYPIIGDGKGADDSSKGVLKKIQKIKPFIKYPLSSDYMSLNILQKYIANIPDKLIVYVAHPKNFNEESFKILKYLVNNYKTFNYKEIS